MAGIGFELRRLTRADGLGANLAGLAYATAISSGPWLVTCAALFLMQWLGHGWATDDELRRHSVLLVYNFSLSLVICGPIVLVVTRLISDDMHAHDASRVAGVFVTALALIVALVSVVGLPLHLGFIAWTPAERVLAVSGLLLTSGVWLVAAFLSALKSYRTIVGAFVGGMTAGVLVTVMLLPRAGALAMLIGLTTAQGLVLALLAGRVLAEFPDAGRLDRRLFDGLRQYWQLALVGLFYNAAIWIDKWIMWFAPGNISPAGGMFSHPTYESAMFYAFLSVVPAMALFLISIETRAYGAYARFYRDIADHATLDEIRVNHRRLLHEMRQAFARTALAQGVVCVLGISAAPLLMQWVGAGQELVPVFRFGLFGAMFHALFMLMMAVLAYLDLRRDLLVVVGVFFVLNTGLTWASVRLGPEYQGYGYALATLLSFGLAWLVVVMRATRLPWLTFVANNAAVRQSHPSEPPRAVAS